MTHDDEDAGLGRIRHFVFGGGAVLVLGEVVLQSFDLFLSLSGTLFPMLAIMSGTLAEHMAVFDQPWIHQALIVVALAYLLNLAIQGVKRARKEITE